MTDAAPLAMAHHPSGALLTSYAAGSLGFGPSLLVATHITYCPNCRAAVTDLEALGGVLVDTLEPIALADGALEAVMARLDPSPAPVRRDLSPAPVRRDLSPAPVRRDQLLAPVGGDPRAAMPAGEAADLPAPVRALLPAQPHGRLPWQRLGPGVRHIPLGGRHADGSQARLLAVDPRTALPEHGHEGDEFTIVLRGWFDDETGRYGRGDVAELDATIKHRPVVGDEPCVCLVVTLAPLRFSNPLIRLIQPFLGL